MIVTEAPVLVWIPGKSSVPQDLQRGLSLDPQYPHLLKSIVLQQLPEKLLRMRTTQIKQLNWQRTSSHGEI